MYLVRLENSSLKETIAKNAKLSKNKELFEIKDINAEKGVSLVITDKNDNALIAKTLTAEGFDKSFIERFKDVVTQLLFANK